jgi:TRAP-type C4-dicarboxylate transport system permease small subunit
MDDKPQQQEHGAPEFGAPRSSWFGTVTSVLNVIGTVLILAMAVAVNADVVGRNVFNRPLPGVLEFVGLAIVAIVFLQMANTLREDRHVSNDILMSFVVASHPRLSAAYYAAAYLVGAVLMSLIVWFMWPYLTEAYERGYFKGTTGLIEIPTWPFLSAVVIGAAVTAIQFLIHAWRSLRRAFTSPQPQS